MKYSCDEVYLENATITLSIRAGVSNNTKITSPIHEDK